MSKIYDTLLEEMDMPDYSFPIKIHPIFKKRKNKKMIINHWHPHIELLFFTSGKAEMTIGLNSFQVKENDLVIVNSNEMHAGISLSDELEYYCIIFDTALLKSSSIDPCDKKFILPLINNQLLFNNKINMNKDVNTCINTIIKEYHAKDLGYELQIKGCLYTFISLLIRHYTKDYLSEAQLLKRDKNLKRINPILDHIEINSSQKMTIDELANMVNMSRYHFCRVFKETTSKSPNDYINQIRINKAEHLLKNSTLNVTEVAMETGFNDLNYFSRLFKKYKNQTPSSLLNTGDRNH